MQVSRDFTIAIHTLICIDQFCNDYKVTSDFISSSVGVNPVIIRRILVRLKAAELIEVKTGVGGAFLLREPSSITLFDIYKAAGCDKKEIFNFHENPNPACPIGRNIHKALDSRINLLTKSLQSELAKMTLADVIKDL